MVRAPESELGLRRTTDMLVPVAEVKVVLDKFVRPEIYRLVEVTDVADIFVNEVVEVKVIVPAVNCMSEVPVTVVPVK